MSCAETHLANINSGRWAHSTTLSALNKQQDEFISDGVDRMNVIVFVKENQPPSQFLSEMFLLSSAATCRIGFQLGNARHRNTVGSLEKREPEWRFWQPLSLSQSFTFPSSLLLLVSLPFLAYSASPRAKSWALVSSPLHPSPQRLCWISARSRSRSELQEGEGEEAVEGGKRREGKKREREAERNSEDREERGDGHEEKKGGVGDTGGLETEDCVVYII